MKLAQDIIKTRSLNTVYDVVASSRKENGFYNNQGVIQCPFISAVIFKLLTWLNLT